MIIDSHQHFWKYNPIRDGWINDKMKVLKRDFLPEDLEIRYKENQIDGCVTIQADQSEDETNFLIGLANRNSFINGIVGWVDLCNENISSRLEYFSEFKIVKGFRHIVQSEPLGFMIHSDFKNGIRQLEKYNFTYDILIYSNQLQEAFELVKKFPNQRFVVDHLAKPEIKLHEFDLWSKGLAQLSLCKNVWCKLSGFTTEADWKNWKSENFTRYFDFALQSFGSDRLMYGSDWPVCLLASSYEKQLALVKDFISKLSAGEKQKIMGGNAIEFYNL
ncbi:MAG: amidohydrolase family protein [Cyclobacteriaceae bacterium]